MCTEGLCDSTVIFSLKHECVFVCIIRVMCAPLTALFSSPKQSSSIKALLYRLTFRWKVSAALCLCLSWFFFSVSLQRVTLFIFVLRFSDDSSCRSPSGDVACHTDEDSCSEESDLTVLSRPPRSGVCIFFVCFTDYLVWQQYDHIFWGFWSAADYLKWFC